MIGRLNALLDHSLDPRREDVPVDGGALDPLAIGILAQIAAFSQLAHQLHGKQGVPASLLEQRLTKGRAEQVGPCVQVGLYEVAPVRLGQLA